MAKGDGKGTKKIKVPKEVGGVKVPKKLRKLGNKAVKAAKNPVVSEVVAGAMLAAAAALREGKDPKTAGAQVKRAGREGADEVRKQAGRLSDSLKALAIDLARRTLDGIEERSRGGEGGGGPREGGETSNGRGGEGGGSGGSIPEKSGSRGG